MDATPKSAAQVYPEDPHLLACNQALLKIKALVQRAPTLQTVAQALLSSHWPKLLGYLDIRDIHVDDCTGSASL